MDPKLFVAQNLNSVKGNHHRLVQTSGLLTLVAAGTGTAGHIWAFRWASTSKRALIRKVVAKWWTTTGFTAAQEVGLEIFRLTSYTAAHTGGTAATLTTYETKKDSAYADATALTDARIGTTGALTAGTHTLDTQAMASGGIQELADGAAVVKKAFEVKFEADPSGPLVLNANQGLLVRNRILGGAAGVWRVAVECDWSEVGI